MTDVTKFNAESVDLDSLRRENEELRRRVAELEILQQSHDDEVLTLRERLQLLDSVIQNSPGVIFVKTLEGHYMVVNRRLATLYGTTCEALLGKSDRDFFSPEAAEVMARKDKEALSATEPIHFEESVPVKEGDIHHYVTIKFPVRNLDGVPIGVCGIATDITDQKRQEVERLQMREHVIAAQEEALRELSTPLVPIAEGVVAMPLVGAIDAKRAELIVTALLDGVSHQGAHTVIMDITGVRTVDAQVAEALVRAARSVRLLGARVIVTGVRPEVARTLVELGADMQGIVTRATLRSGIASALGK